MPTYVFRFDMEGRRSAERVRDAIVEQAHSCGDLEILDSISPEVEPGIDNDPTAVAPFPEVFTNVEISLMQDAMRTYSGMVTVQKHPATAKELLALANRLESFRRPGPDAVSMTRAGMLHLRGARDLFVMAGADKAADRVRLAIASAGGAVRNAEIKASRDEVYGRKAVR